MLIVSEPHEVNGKLVGYFLSMSKDNAEHAGKYLTKQEYDILCGAVIQEKVVLKDIHPAKLAEVIEPVTTGNYFAAKENAKTKSVKKRKNEARVSG